MWGRWGSHTGRGKVFTLTLTRFSLTPGKSKHLEDARSWLLVRNCLSVQTKSQITVAYLREPTVLYCSPPCTSSAAVVCIKQFRRLLDPLSDKASH